MKWFTKLTIVAVVLIAGMYGWYLFASVINNHADQAATVIIQDTLASNSAFNTKKLLEIDKVINSGNTDKASDLIRKLIESNISSIEDCVTKQCNELKQQLNK
jgi:hypothetical protein